jgi:hypothetical protein
VLGAAALAGADATTAGVSEGSGGGACTMVAPALLERVIVARTRLNLSSSSETLPTVTSSPPPAAALWHSASQPLLNVWGSLSARRIGLKLPGSARTAACTFACCCSVCERILVAAIQLASVDGRVGGSHKGTCTAQSSFLAPAPSIRPSWLLAAGLLGDADSGRHCEMVRTASATACAAPLAPAPRAFGGLLGEALAARRARVGAWGEVFTASSAAKRCFWGEMHAKGLWLVLNWSRASRPAVPDRLCQGLFSGEPVVCTSVKRDLQTDLLSSERGLLTLAYLRSIAAYPPALPARSPR